MLSVDNMNMNMMNADDNQKKWMSSAIGGVAYLVVASPMTYKLTHSILGRLGLKTAVGGCPTGMGVLVHAVVFAGVTHAIMHFMGSNLSNEQAWRHSLTAGLLFAVVSAPTVLRVSASLVKVVPGMGGVLVLDKKGCPSQVGVLFHAVVYALLARALMELK